MASVLTAHLFVGLLALLAALTLVWRLPGRRLTLYVLTLQILLGGFLMAAGFRISPLHIVLALVGWGLYMAANALARRQAPAPRVLVLTSIGTLCVVLAGAIGSMAMHQK